MLCCAVGLTLEKSSAAALARRLLLRLHQQQQNTTKKNRNTMNAFATGSHWKTSRVWSYGSHSVGERSCLVKGMVCRRDINSSHILNSACDSTIGWQ